MPNDKSSTWRIDCEDVSAIPIHRIGAQHIERRVIALTDQLCAGLEERGYQVTSHRTEESEKSAIVTFIHPTFDGQTLMDRLTEANVTVSLRAGGIRVSPHYYNSEAEVDHIIAILPK